MRLARALVVAVVATVAVTTTASARPAEHVKPSLEVRLSGAARVPGGIHFSPIRDPDEGRWRGSLSWQADCGNADWTGWAIHFVDVSTGTYRSPDAGERPMSTHTHFWRGAYVPRSRDGRSEPVEIPAGSIVYPYLTGRCHADGHDLGNVGAAEGDVFVVPPYVWYPTFAVGGRTLQSTGAIVLGRNRPVAARIRVAESATRAERVAVNFRGAGVNVRRTYAPGQLERPRVVRFTPTRRGVIRYWASMEGRSSLVYGIRVR